MKHVPVDDDIRIEGGRDRRAPTTRSIASEIITNGRIYDGNEKKKAQVCVLTFGKYATDDVNDHLRFVSRGMFDR